MAANQTLIRPEPAVVVVEPVIMVVVVAQQPEVTILTLEPAVVVVLVTSQQEQLARQIQPAAGLILAIHQIHIETVLVMVVVVAPVLEMEAAATTD
jgi:hypothetical protein